MLKIWATETLQRITELMIEASNDYGGTEGELPFGAAGVDMLGAYYTARPTTIMALGRSSNVYSFSMPTSFSDIPNYGAPDTPPDSVAARARPMAVSIARALASVSAHSRSGTESATMPAPACTVRASWPPSRCKPPVSAVPW